MKHLILIHFFWVNVLGYSHTAPGGNEAWRLDGQIRQHIMDKVIVAHHADLGVLNEFEHPQAEVFRRELGAIYALDYIGTDTRNSIFYRRSLYKIIGYYKVNVPYFDGRRINIPVARLHNRKTDRNIVVMAVHNPADTRRFPHQLRWRLQALNIEIRAVNCLERMFPYAQVVVAGDWNSRQYIRIRMLRDTDLHSPITSQYIPIDQTFGNPKVKFSHYQRITSPRIRRSTDHNYVYQVNIGRR